MRHCTKAFSHLQKLEFFYHSRPWKPLVLHTMWFQHCAASICDGMRTCYAVACQGDQSSRASKGQGHASDEGPPMPSKIGPRRPMRETPAGPPQSPRRAPAEPQSWAELGLRRAACRPMRETPAGSLGDHWGITGGSLVSSRVGKLGPCVLFLN